MRCYIYIRVSTDGQEDNASLDTQLAACLRKAEEEGWQVVGIYREVHSGADLSRPELDRMREGIRNGEVDVVLAYHPDRWSRDQINTAIMYNELRESDVLLRFVQGRFEDSPLGVFILGAVTFAAEVERAQFRERSLRGKESMRSRALPIFEGKDPYGYIRNAEERRYDVVEEEAAVVKWIYEQVVDGLSVPQILKELNRRGWRTRAGAEWQATSVRQLIRNPAYKGWHVINRFVDYKEGRKKKRRQNPPDKWRVLDDTGKVFPPIVSEAVWDRCYEGIKKRSTIHSRNEKRFFLLRGRVTCGKCGSRAYVVSAGAGWYYFCSNAQKQHAAKQDNRKATETCDAQRIRVEKLHERVWAEIVKLADDPSEIVRRAEEATTRGPDPRLNADRHQLVKHLKDLEEQVDGLVMSLANPKLPDRTRARIEAQIAEVDTQVAEAERRLGEIDEQLQAQAEAIERANRFALYLQKLVADPSILDRATEEEQDALIRALDAQIWIFDREHIELRGYGDEVVSRLSCAGCVRNNPLFTLAFSLAA